MSALVQTLTVASGEVLLRSARREDVAAIVALLAADQVGARREDPDADLAPYLSAFETIAADPAHLLLVVDDGGVVVATLQVSLLPGLARRGALRMQLEAVRVHEDHRGRGLGTAVVRWAVAEAARRGCALVQLTSDARREDAHRFYARLGFSPSHVGFKLSPPTDLPPS